jgi:hypothetical protein
MFDLTFFRVGFGQAAWRSLHLGEDVAFSKYADSISIGEIAIEVAFDFVLG